MTGNLLILSSNSDRLPICSVIWKSPDDDVMKAFQCNTWKQNGIKISFIVPQRGDSGGTAALSHVGSQRNKTILTYVKGKIVNNILYITILCRLLFYPTRKISL